MQLTPDEEQRRTLRRERNKVAASKCRMKRKEHVNTLRKVGVHLWSFSVEVSLFVFSNTFLKSAFERIQTPLLGKGKMN